MKNRLPKSVEKTAMEILSQHQAERDVLGGHLMNALHAAMPWDLEIELPHGAKATLLHVGAPSRAPLYENNASPVSGNAEPISYGPWKFIFDFELKNCDQDHIEVTCFISGGGGAT